MHIKTLIGAIAAVVVAAGALYVIAQGRVSQPALSAQDTAQRPVQSSMGTFSYECDNGASLTMTPADDLSAVSIAPNGAMSEGKVPEATLAAQPFDGGPATFAGQGVSMVGAGEEITLTFGGATVHCNPTPNPDLAPFNWGDAGDGGGR